MMQYNSKYTRHSSAWRLVAPGRELEKKFPGRHIVIVVQTAQRTILSATFNAPQRL